MLHLSPVVVHLQKPWKLIQWTMAMYQPYTAFQHVNLLCRTRFINAATRLIPELSQLARALTILWGPSFHPTQGSTGQCCA